MIAHRKADASRVSGLWESNESLFYETSTDGTSNYKSWPIHKVIAAGVLSVRGTIPDTLKDKLLQLDGDGGDVDMSKMSSIDERNSCIAHLRDRIEYWVVQLIQKGSGFHHCFKIAEGDFMELVSSSVVEFMKVHLGESESQGVETLVKKLLPSFSGSIL